METSFLRDAIDRIVALSTPSTVEVDGRTYCNKTMTELGGQHNRPDTYYVDTLDALIKMIRTEGVGWVDVDGRLNVRVVSAREVSVVSSYMPTKDNMFDRAKLYYAKTDVPSVTIGAEMSQEQAIVELQSLYGATPDRDYLLDLLSRIDVNQGVSSVDNGVTQEVSVRTGAVLKEKMSVRPIVRLQPYRTFLEVSQPVSDFLLRVSKSGYPALFEADGGAWKLEAKRNIAAYLGEQLSDLVESGKVVVMI